VGGEDVEGESGSDGVGREVGKEVVVKGLEVSREEMEVEDIFFLAWVGCY
jgi:hypothetical protein